MIFTSTKIDQLYVIELEKKEDSRGFLARVFDKEQFRKYGILLDVVQGYTCLTKKKGTFRGFHYSDFSHNDIKLTRVISGSL